jgi:hypothetical protein
MHCVHLGVEPAQEDQRQVFGFLGHREEA